MHRIRIVVTLLAVSLLGAGYLQDKDKKAKKAEDRKTEEKPTLVIRGQLPPYFKKLGVSSEQRTKILQIRADYKSRADELKRQLEKLKSEEKAAIEKVLTPEQRKRLRELRTGENSSE